MDLKQLVAAILDIKTQATAIADRLNKAAQAGQNAPQSEIDNLGKLIDTAAATRDQAKEVAAIERDKRIGHLREMIQGYDDALELVQDDAVSERLEAGQEKAEADLALELASVGTDFGGILSSDDLHRIQLILTQSKSELATRQQAAAVIAVSIEVAHVALDVATKLGLAVA